MLLLSVGILGRSTSVAQAAGTLSAPVDHAAHGASVLTDNGRDKDVSKEKRADADLALRMAMDAGELAAIVIAIHATADIASLDVLDEARALRARIRQDMREGNHRKEVEPLSPAAADAGLRTAMEDRTLEGLVDAIHSNSGAASPEVLRAAKDVRDELRDEKHAAAGQKTETPKPGATTGQTAPMVPASSAIDADAALRAAMSARKLDGLVDAIHGNSDAASPAVLSDAKDLRDELRDAKHAAAGGEETGAGKEPTRRSTAPGVAPVVPFSSGPGSLTKFAAVERLSDIFFNAIPSDDLSKVGLTIHCWDATEEIPREPWRPCGSGQCTQFQNWWSASTINWANHFTFGDAGIIMEPERNSVLCSYPFDSGTMNGGCISGRPENLSRVISQSMFWQHMGYNEILMNSSDFMAKLPGSIAAFVFNLKGEGNKGVTYFRYQQFLKHFKLTDADVPLLRANFNGLGMKANASMGTGFNGSWRTQKKQYADPYKCGGGADLHATFQSWYNGECPPTLLSMDKRKNCEAEDKCSAAEIPLFTDMTVHAREYLRVNSQPPEEEAPAWHQGKNFRVGANKEVPSEYERLRAMGEDEFQRDLRRSLKAMPASEAYAGGKSTGRPLGAL